MKQIAMAGKNRKITISISNDELDMMENFLVCELPKDLKDNYRRRCLQIWSRLVREWDKPESAKS